MPDRHQWRQRYFADRAQAKKVQRSFIDRLAPAGTWLLALSLAVLLLWGGGIGLRSVLARTFLRTAHVTQGVLEERVAGEAFVLRNEQVFLAPLDGTLHLGVGEGERVRVGGVLFSITAQGTVQERQAMVAQARRELEDFQSACADRRTNLRAQLVASDARLEEVLARLRWAQTMGKPRVTWEQVALLKKERQRQAPWQEELDRLQVKETALQALVAERELNLERVYVEERAQVAGLVSYAWDGLEELCYPEGLTVLDPSALSRAKPVWQERREGDWVTAGQPVCRLIDEREYLLLVKLPDTVGYQPGQEMPIRIGDWEKRARLLQTPAHLVEAGYLLFAVEGSGGRLWQERMVPVTVVVESVSGVIVPESAVVAGNSVYILHELKAERIPVQVLGQIGKQVAVSGVKPGAQVVLNPWLVRDGQRLR